MFSNNEYQELEEDLRATREMLQAQMKVNRGLQYWLERIILSEADGVVDYEALGYPETESFEVPGDLNGPIVAVQAACGWLRFAYG